MLTYSFGELLDKLCITHLKIWHIEDEIERMRNNEDQLEEINSLLDQVVTLNKLRVDIVESINELFEKKQP